MTEPSAPKAWPQRGRDRIQSCRVFHVARIDTTSPHTGAAHTFYTIEADDWVNVIPVTREGEIVMVRQFRHGPGEVTLEVPGGIIDPGEDPATAAARETLEETGYAGAEPKALGSLNPNPALFGNRCFTFVIEQAEPVAEIANTATEETVVELVPRDRVREMLDAGRIDHALVAAALYRYLLDARN